MSVRPCQAMRPYMAILVMTGQECKRAPFTPVMRAIHNSLSWYLKHWLCDARLTSQTSVKQVKTSVRPGQTSVKQGQDQCQTGLVQGQTGPVHGQYKAIQGQYRVIQGQYRVIQGQSQYRVIQGQSQYKARVSIRPKV